MRRYPFVANVKRLAAGGVTLVWSEHDRITPKELWGTARAYELTIANSGHSPMLENSTGFDVALAATLVNGGAARQDSESKSAAAA